MSNSATAAQTPRTTAGANGVDSASRPSARMTIRWCCWSAGPRCCRGPIRCVSGSRRAAGGWSATTCAIPERRRPSTRKRQLRSARSGRRRGGACRGARWRAGSPRRGRGRRDGRPGRRPRPSARVLGADVGEHSSGRARPGRRRLAGPRRGDHGRGVLRPMPDWTDRAAVAAFAADGAALLGNDPEQARAVAARIWDRTPSGEPSVHQANQLGMVFSRLDCTPRWRERLGEVTLPTLVVHGARIPSSRWGTARRSPPRSTPRGCSSSTTWAPPCRTPPPTRSPPRCSPADPQPIPPHGKGLKAPQQTSPAAGLDDVALLVRASSS